MLHCKPAKGIINNSRSDWFSKANTLVWAEPCARWAELKMLSFWAGGISSFPPCAREYRLLRRLCITETIDYTRHHYWLIPSKYNTYLTRQDQWIGPIFLHRPTLTQIISCIVFSSSLQTIDFSNCA